MPRSIFTVAELDRRDGASPAAIAAVEHALGVAMPEDYRSFLLESDGAEGFVGSEAYLTLWSTHDLADLNAAYAVSEFAPGLILIGTDGADTGYGFVSRAAGAEYVRVPLVGMSLDSVDSMGETLADLVRRLRTT